MYSFKWQVYFELWTLHRGQRPQLDVCGGTAEPTAGSSKDTVTSHNSPTRLAHLSRRGSVFLWACTHLHRIMPLRLRMRRDYYMISAALFKARYSRPIVCWIKHEVWAAGVCVCVCDGWVQWVCVRMCVCFFSRDITDDPSIPLIWHTSPLPCWVSGNYHLPRLKCPSLFAHFLFVFDSVELVNKI